MKILLPFILGLSSALAAEKGLGLMTKNKTVLLAKLLKTSAGYRLSYCGASGITLKACIDRNDGNLPPNFIESWVKAGETWLSVWPNPGYQLEKAVKVEKEASEAHVAIVIRMNHVLGAFDGEIEDINLELKDPNLSASDRAELEHLLVQRQKERATVVKDYEEELNDAQHLWDNATATLKKAQVQMDFYQQKVNYMVGEFAKFDKGQPIYLNLDGQDLGIGQFFFSYLHQQMDQAPTWTNIFKAVLTTSPNGSYASPIPTPIKKKALLRLFSHKSEADCVLSETINYVQNGTPLRLDPVFSLDPVTEGSITITERFYVLNQPKDDKNNILYLMPKSACPPNPNNASLGLIIR